ncbi:DUF2254 domain-containing protein [Georgenia thermotolerans]|uniref:DUF2254 domain-containing protein n=1 Tax=Georgenia thermotolerans TaxID=527326 RepID=A0A7J5UR76_9MICO|nr:DUF2254 domain-containing protein [Georgenia thermotolerans]KAE8764849.1 DUF2254 domain-containing protein [Georgenia thermotolerans]
MEAVERLRERFWFLPALMCVVAAVVAEVLVAVDQRGFLPLPSWAGSFVYRVGESGSRDILAAIATSSLAVAGTTFSITVAVLALTSSTYGPRLVRNFMADRANQAVLGAFVATFLYSLLVLRSVRTLGDPRSSNAEVFVPHLAVNFAVVLALVNVALLVFFIHHIADSIQVTTIARRVREDLRAAVDRLYPEELGSGAADVPVDDEETGERKWGASGKEGVRVEAGRAGYVRFIRDDALMSAARGNDLLVEIQVYPGSYVLQDSAVCIVHPSEHMSDDVARRVRSAVVVGDARSPYQDVGFAVQQLTELVVRALSPGTNDPFTAVNAVDDLSDGLSLLATRKMPSPSRFDRDHVLRVYAPYPDVVALTASVLDNLRWYGAGSPAVMHAALTLIERVAVHARQESVRVALGRQVPALAEAFLAAGHQPRDLEAFLGRAEQVSAALA